MGRGIAQTFAQAEYPVFLHDVTEEILGEAMRQIGDDLRELADLCVIDADQIQPAVDRIRTTTSLDEAVAAADLVVESVFEDLSLKRDVFRELDAICQEHTILGSNSSFLMPSQLAAATNRPDRVLVMHHFYPAHLLPLVEVVPSALTSKATVDTVCDLMKESGKRPVIVRKEVPGFIANRLQTALVREAMYLLNEEIATPQDIDIAVKSSFGRRLAVVGPFELGEVQGGWDVAVQVAPYIFPHLSNATEIPEVILRQVEKGEVGASSGKGFYEWTPRSLRRWRRDLAEALARFKRA